MLHWLAAISAIIVTAVSGTFGSLFGAHARVSIAQTPVIASSTAVRGYASTSPVTAATPATSTPITQEASTTKPVQHTEKPAPAVPPVPADWATFSSALGFSVSYPAKEVSVLPFGQSSGEFTMLFFVSPAVVTSNASTTQNISIDLQALNLLSPFTITVVQDVPTTANLQSWATSYLKDHADPSETVLSQTSASAKIAGNTGVTFTRKIEEFNSGGSRYVREETFIRKQTSVYRFSVFVPTSETKFSRSGSVGEAYLQRAQTLAQQVFAMFVLDGSKITAFHLPKTPPAPIRAGSTRAQRDALLAALREKPYYDVHTWYPTSSESCQGASSTDPTTQGAISNYGLFVSGDDSIADLNVYDSQGRHTGPFPSMPDFAFSGGAAETQIPDVQWMNLGSAGYGPVFDRLINGKITLVGKKTGFVNLFFRGDGNACTIAYILLPVTPYSIATIPMPTKGDLGPISYDIDGDGVEDVEISLVHPLLPQKELQLEAVFTDITGIKISK